MSRPTTRAGREARAQLNAYAKWNPNNDPEKSESLAELQAAIDELRAHQLGQAVVTSGLLSPSFPDRDRARWSEKLRNVKLGRALIAGNVNIPHNHRQGLIELGDGTFVNGAVVQLEGRVKLFGTTVEGGVSTFYNSSIEDSIIRSSEVRDTEISTSSIDRTVVLNSTVTLCDLVKTKVEDGVLCDVVGSSGGATIGGLITDAEVFYAEDNAYFRFVA